MVKQVWEYETASGRTCYRGVDCRVVPEVGDTFTPANYPDGELVITGVYVQHQSDEGK